MCITELKSPPYALSPFYIERRSHTSAGMRSGVKLGPPLVLRPRAGHVMIFEFRTVALSRGVLSTQTTRLLQQ